VRGSGVAFLVLAMILATASCRGDDEDEPATTPGPASPAVALPTSLYDLAPGDCFRGLGRNQDIRVRLRACTEPHQAEVYGTVELSAARYPGVEVLRQRAATDCAQRFAGYTGEPAGPGTELAFVEVVPTLDSWAAGDRRALCVALGVGGAPLRASIAAGGAP
jgi:Septum formation